MSEFELDLAVSLTTAQSHDLKVSSAIGAAENLRELPLFAKII